MEFETQIDGRVYRISLWHKDSYLVSAEDGDYIIYKTGIWKCADTLHPGLLEALGSAIEKRDFNA